MRPHPPLWYTFFRHLPSSSSRYSEYLIAGLTPDLRAALSDSAALRTLFTTLGYGAQTQTTSLAQTLDWPDNPSHPRAFVPYVLTYTDITDRVPHKDARKNGGYADGAA